MKDWGERTGGKKRHGGISGYLDVGVGGVGLVGVGWGAISQDCGVSKEKLINCQRSVREGNSP